MIAFAAGDIPDLKDLEDVFVNGLKGLVSLAGLGALIMIIAGGFKYLTSGGDQKALQDATKILTYAVLGLIGAIAAYFIINTLFGSNILDFPNIFQFTFTEEL